MFKKHTTLFLFPTNLKFKNHAIFSAGSREKNMFAKHEPGSNKHPWSCKHLANAHVKPMKNIENTMKFPPTKRLRMDIHDLNICYPSANSFRLTATPPGNPTYCNIEMFKLLVRRLLCDTLWILGYMGATTDYYSEFYARPFCIFW